MKPINQIFIFIFLITLFFGLSGFSLYTHDTQCKFIFAFKWLKFFHSLIYQIEKHVINLQGEVEA